MVGDIPLRFELTSGSAEIGVLSGKRITGRANRECRVSTP